MQRTSRNKSRVKTDQFGYYALMKLDREYIHIIIICISKKVQNNIQDHHQSSFQNASKSALIITRERLASVIIRHANFLIFIEKRDIGASEVSAVV